MGAAQGPARVMEHQARVLWGVNMVVALLVLVTGSCSYIKHHPGLIGEDLAQGAKLHAHSDLSKDASDIKREHDKGIVHSQAHSGRRAMNLKSSVKVDQDTAPSKPALSEKHPVSQPRAGGLLPQIPIKYLPFVVVGFMLMVPILTISVLKGCWAMIDMFVPTQGAPKPNNYAQRKLQEAEGPEADVERACE